MRNIVFTKQYLKDLEKSLGKAKSLMKKSWMM